MKYQVMVIERSGDIYRGELIAQFAKRVDAESFALDKNIKSETARFVVVEHEQYGED